MIDIIQVIGTTETKESIESKLLVDNLETVSKEVVKAINEIKNSSNQIQSDWTQADNTKVDFIKNKPTIPDELSDLTDDATHRLVTDTEKSTWNGKQPAMGADDNYVTNAEKASLFDEYDFAASDENTVITQGVAKFTDHWKSDFFMTSLFIGLNAVSSSSSSIFDWNDHTGTSIFSTRPTILAGEETSLTNPDQPILTTPAGIQFYKGQKFSIDFDLVGTGVKGVKIHAKGRKS